MKKIAILLLLLSTGLFAQGYDGYAKTGPVTATDGKFTSGVTIDDTLGVDGNVRVGGKVVITDSLRVEKTSIFKGNVTITVDIFVQDSLAVTGNVTIGGKIIVDDSVRIDGTLNSDNISITMDDPYIYFDPTTASESAWYMGTNNDGNSADNDAFEIRQSATPGSSVELSLQPDGDMVLTGDLTITGDDLFMTTNTNRAVLMGDGTNYNPELIDLSTDTDGNYVTSVTTSALTGLTGGATAAENVAITLGLDRTATLAADPAVVANGWVPSTTGIIFEGATADGIETLVAVTDPTSADKTITLPNATGTIAVSATAPVTLSALGDVGLTQNAGTDITADLEEEVTEGSLADAVIVSADIKDATIAWEDLATATQDSAQNADKIKGKAVVTPTATEDGYVAIYLSATEEITWTPLNISYNWYGVSWDAGADTYIRLGALADSAASSTIPDAYLPIQRRMKRCLLKNDGTVYKYLRSDNSNYYEDGSAADLDGPYQVMVEIPLFYYYYHYSGIDSVYSWLVSEDSLAGFDRHQAFIKDGAYVDYRYCGAYEGALYDVSNSAYLNGLYLPTTATYQFSFIDGGAEVDTIRCINGSGSALTHPFTNLETGEKIVISGSTNNDGTVTVVDVADAYFTVATATITVDSASANIYAQTNFAADTLASVSGKAPIVQGTRANFRTAASLRGTGWRQYDYQLLSAIQLLYLVEFADFNSQSKIGNGLTDWSSAWPGWNDDNPITKTGLSDAKGNSTFNLSNGNGVTGSYMTYRGIENWYGHMWKFIDGININGNIAYWCNNETQYADGTATNYSQIGTLINSDGWQKYLLNTLHGFLPNAVGASSSTYIADYYYQSTGWRVALVGGGVVSGVIAGAFCMNMGAPAGSAFADRSVAGRLCR